MTAHIFFNPEIVGQLAFGIASRRSAAQRTQQTGFVLERRRVPASARQTITNVIAVQDHVTIIGPRPNRPTPRAPAPSTATAPQTALELVTECERLRRDNQLLTDEVTRLRGQLANLAGGSALATSSTPSDDTSIRFGLLELD